MADDFYVYVYFRLNGSPCYVGKGRGDRWRHRGQSCRNKALRKIRDKADRKLPCVKVREHLSECEAYDIEYALIQAVGRTYEGGPLVNIAGGGPGTVYGFMQAHPRKGRALSEETKRKIGDANRGRKMSEEVKEAMRRRPVHPNTIAAVKKANTGRKHTAETRAKVSAAGLGRKRRTPLTEEQRKRRSEAARGRKHSAETIAKRKASNAGFRHSAETKAKISAAGKARKPNLVALEALLKCRGPGMTGKKHSEAARKKMAESARAAHARKLAGG